MTREMRFTDDDLKLVKARPPTGYDWILALIARLEAAEKFVRGREHLDIKMEPKERELLEAWRKAAGK